MDTPCTAILLVMERDTPCTSELLAAEMDTPFTAILLVIERDMPCTSKLLAVERDIETKAQTFRYRSLLSEIKQNILISSAYYRNESRTFQSVPKLFKIESERFGDFLKFKNEIRTKPSKFIIVSKCIHTPRLQRKQNRTFVILKNYIKTKPKHLKFRQGFLKTKENF
jgi:hypothetical protein